jgi:hypothetical protein
VLYGGGESITFPKWSAAALLGQGIIELYPRSLRAYRIVLVRSSLGIRVKSAKSKPNKAGIIVRLLEDR